MPGRFLTSVVVRLQGQLYLFDAGEGCQINLKKTKLGIKSLRVVAVSHLHGDHCLGLPGLLMMRAQVPEVGPLTILGPPGIERFIRQIHESLAFFLNYPLSFLEWHEGCPEVAYEDDLVRILWGPLKHTTLCLGYRLEEHPRPGKFKTEAAKALGIPYGPLWGKLQRGETVTLDQGETHISQPCARAPKARTEDLLRRRYAAQQSSLSTLSGCGYGVPRRDVLTRTSRGSRGEGTHDGRRCSTSRCQSGCAACSACPHQPPVHG